VLFGFVRDFWSHLLQDHGPERWVLPRVGGPRPQVIRLHPTPGSALVIGGLGRLFAQPQVGLLHGRLGFNGEHALERLVAGEPAAAGVPGPFLGARVLLEGGPRLPGGARGLHTRIPVLGEVVHPERFDEAVQPERVAHGETLRVRRIKKVRNALPPPAGLHAFGMKTGVGSVLRAINFNKRS